MRFTNPSPESKFRNRDPQFWVSVTSEILLSHLILVGMLLYPLWVEVWVRFGELEKAKYAHSECLSQPTSMDAVTFW